MSTMNSENKKNYWGYRIDTKETKFFWKELIEGRLHQGWGCDAGQNLKSMTVDKGARRNLRMLQVKQGDILVVPGLPESGYVTLVEATKDWNENYYFDIPEIGDYGHIFPAKIIVSCKRNNVGDAIRSSLHCRLRFWNMNRCGDQIENLLMR